MKAVVRLKTVTLTDAIGNQLKRQSREHYSKLAVGLSILSKLSLLCTVLSSSDLRKWLFVLLFSQKKCA